MMHVCARNCSSMVDRLIEVGQPAVMGQFYINKTPTGTYS